MFGQIAHIGFGNGTQQVLVIAWAAQQMNYLDRPLELARRHHHHRLLALVSDEDRIAVVVRPIHIGGGIRTKLDLTDMGYGDRLRYLCADR